ncbi:HK97 gp10 family phage protein [Leeia sp. TBRC 13508]|uniref:HK97 gp10 family phage protein n=1 Tax=Leeia speluncae TaxID=2884804 RepID=A0ABS8D7U4_9NEIS|nr:HK97-gp10 family putative phage morphogenesis protein [Leeia speluncae]MCB6184284.1 HK97 gp10 family phage protein [Leeia speluncae]
MLKVSAESTRVFDTLKPLPEMALSKAALKRVGLAGGGVIKREAMQMAPRLTGRLSRSIIAWVPKSADGDVLVKVGPKIDRARVENRGILSKKLAGRRKGKKVIYVVPWYGRFLEFGTKYIQPRPFMVPAATASENATLTAMYDRAVEESVAVLGKL